jgi:transcriptional regulator with XRE-family HTH domain
MAPRSGTTLGLLLRLLDMKVTELATSVGMPRQRIDRFVHGDQEMRIGEAEDIARALDLPPTIWFIDPDEAVRFVLDQGRLGAESQSM